ncbi:MAG: hypothetical protein LBO80_02360 [Treponema sp.]|jgi:hypothetical protein|nr:hypothetical protein [Treponema sp.]
MRRYLAVFGVIAGVLAILGLAAYAFFEVYPRPKYLFPSGEALYNEYLALDRWLNQTGHPVRAASEVRASSLAEAKEGVVFIQVSFLDKELLPELETLAASGISLIVSLDESWDEETDAFLRGLGLEGTFGPEAEEKDGAAPRTDSSAGPVFDRQVRFILRRKLAGRGDVRTLTDEEGIIRLVTVPLESGSITLMGIPFFMMSVNLGNETNARLAWELTGGRDRENRGVLFFRENRISSDGQEEEEGFFTKLFSRGRVIPLAISILALTVIGFWMVIPRFGVTGQEDRSAAKPIRERFLAEARFLEKHHALGAYLDVYIQEIRVKLRRREGDFDEAGLVPLVKKICRLGDEAEEIINHKEHKEKIGVREFIKYREIIESILERL